MVRTEVGTGVIEGFFVIDVEAGGTGDICVTDIVGCGDLAWSIGYPIEKPDWEGVDIVLFIK